MTQHEKIVALLEVLKVSATDSNPFSIPAINNIKSRERFVVRMASRLKPVTIDEIAYFFADNRLNFITTWQGQKFVINHSMDELVNQLPQNDFYRISRSFIVSYKSIGVIQVQERNRLKLLLTPPFKNDVFVSRDKVADFRLWIGDI
jgi:two-component system, LytTR family, response regulator LytT